MCKVQANGNKGIQRFLVLYSLEADETVFQEVFSCENLVLVDDL